MMLLNHNSNIKEKEERPGGKGDISKKSRTSFRGKTKPVYAKRIPAGDFGYALPLSIIRIMRGDSGF